MPRHEHKRHLQFSIPPSDQQYSRENNWYCQAVMEKGERWSRQSNSVMDVQNNTIEGPLTTRCYFKDDQKSFLLSSDRMYKSRHQQNDQHVEHNTKRQEDQAKFIKRVKTEDHSILVNLSTYTTKSADNGNPGQL